MREAKTGATARKILKTQKSALGWTLFLSNFLLLALGLGCLLLYYLKLYAGSWEALGETSFTWIWLEPVRLDPLPWAAKRLSTMSPTRWPCFSRPMWAFCWSRV